MRRCVVLSLLRWKWYLASKSIIMVMEYLQILLLINVLTFRYALLMHQTRGVKVKNSYNFEIAMYLPRSA